MQAPESLSAEEIQRIIEEAGYHFVGILPAFVSATGKKYEAQALWLGQETGSTYALPLSELSINEVRAHTYSQELKFKTGGPR